MSYSPRPKREVTCETCGKTAFTHVRNWRFCSQTCKDKFWSRTESCGLCGAAMWRSSTPSDSRFCWDCRKVEGRHGTVAEYKKRGCRCERCRKAWAGYNAKYQKAARARARKPRDCDQCGTSFIPRSNQVRCSDACMRSWRAANHAGRRGASDVGPIDPLEIYERDGWICALCELPVDPTETYPSPGYPTLDHILPISLGGKHAAENLQLAHSYCNGVKGNRVEATAC